ncbi:hypothetical protein CCACVL1_04674, partial [Corchorus capsularis]
MGVFDNMLHKEISIVTSGGHSDGRLEKVPAETGHFAPTLRYKQHKVLAIRDFPPGCGWLSTARPSEHMQVPVISESGTPELSGLQKDSSEDNFATSKEEVVRRSVKSHSGESSLEKPSARNHCPSRGVTVVRDFPPFCGRNAPPLSGEECMKLLPRASSAFVANKNDIERSIKTCTRKNSCSTKRAYQGTSQVATWNNEDTLQHHRQHLAQKSYKYDVSLPTPCPSSNDATITRSKVRETLRLFQVICRKLLQEEESKLLGEGRTRRRVDLQAAKILKEKGKYVNTGKQIIGPVPGVEVASGGYDDDLENSDVLIYMGQGGNVMQKGKQPQDQKLERGNLALANSKFVKNPVRVIRGETRSSDVSEGRCKTYVYDGLYVVVEFKKEVGPHSKLVYKFKLVRIPGQPELAWRVVKKSHKSRAREGLCAHDISQGKEIIPICAINTIDAEMPPPFAYVPHMIYPDWCHPLAPKGCDCINGCLESGNCSCLTKNGGEIPYNHNGAIVRVKPLVYECGPTCKCLSSCYNRVSQHGIKFLLEIFKTESRGWGVRSLDSIPSGSFICEYVGELLEDTEAEKRTGNDEYLFDIGDNYSDHSLFEGLSSLIPDAHLGSCPVVENSGFTIDAAKCGNIGRFINHSCSPNLYAQNVLYDHDDRRIPHIMLFAAENIPPLQELTYHYNYKIDQVHDEN